jgi:hypothetical protein
MKSKLYILVVLALALFVGSIVPEALADSARSQEYQIKAAFLYNFIKFVEWPEEKVADSNEPITIGIIGKDPFGNAFEPLKGRQAKGRKVVVKRIKGFERLKKSGAKGKAELQRIIDAIRKCHVLFICSSEKEKLKEIINSVKDHPVLTVGDVKGFLETGGVVNFLMEEKKVRFEINLAAAKRAKLRIRSKLLRLAKRVVEEKSQGGTKK